MTETSGEFTGKSTIVVPGDGGLIELLYAEGMFEGAPGNLQKQGRQLDEAVKFLRKEGFEGKFGMSPSSVCLFEVISPSKEEDTLPARVAVPLCAGITYLLGPQSFAGAVYEFEDITDRINYEDHCVFRVKFDLSDKEATDRNDVWGTLIFTKEPFEFVGSYDWIGKWCYDRTGAVLQVPDDVLERFREIESAETLLQEIKQKG